jgi:osmotically-inducible protein OsmY
MKLRTTAVLLSLLAALGGLPLAGCSSSPQSRSTGQVIDDGTITARVKTALAREAGVTDAMNVNVNTYRGVVQLSGFVDSKALVERAERVAQGVDGVKSVKNDLRVAP